MTASRTSRSTSRRHELRQDRFITFFARAWGFFDRNRTLAYGLLAGLVVLILLGIGYAYYHNQQQQEAQRRLGAIISVYESGDYQAALEGTGGQMGLLEISEAYGGTQAGNLATFYAADALYQLGEYDRALALFEAFDREENLLGAGALAGIAAIYEDQGAYEEAAQYYREAAALYESAATSPYYLLDAARAYEAAGAFEQALETYRMIEAQYPESPPAQQVAQHIARVKVRQSR